MIRSLLVLATALSLAACATAPPTTGIGGSPDPAPIADAKAAAVETAAKLADAVQVAPPATLTGHVTIDDKAIRIAFKTWDASLTIIDAAVSSGAVVPGSEVAISIKSCVDAITAYLQAASAAQQVGDAKSYSDALERARFTVSQLQLALALSGTRP